MNRIWPDAQSRISAKFPDNQLESDLTPFFSSVGNCGGISCYIEANWRAKWKSWTQLTSHWIESQDGSSESRHRVWRETEMQSHLRVRTWLRRIHLGRMRRCERVNDVLQRNWWSWELCDEVEEIQCAHLWIWGYRSAQSSKSHDGQFTPLINGQASEGGIRENLRAPRHGGQMSSEQWRWM